MISLALIAVPLLFAAIGWHETLLNRTLRRLILPCSAAAQLVLAALALMQPAHRVSLELADSCWLALDLKSLAVLLVTTLLYLAVAWQSYFSLDAEELEPRSERLLICGMPAFLGAMNLVALAQNFGLLWVAIEATTLVSAPLIMCHRSGRAVEAMWKYLLICSVGIGLALFGTILLELAAEEGGLPGSGLDFARFMFADHEPAPSWFMAAFIFALAGYGTKMGLAPFHTWLPDAHSEAPGTVSALLSGALLNCAFLGIMRFLDAAPSTLANFTTPLLIASGVLSLCVALFFIIRQSDFKRMLAYSSIEHMGLLAIMAGIGADDLALLHMSGHSLVKMSLFLLAGNLYLASGSKQVAALRGAWSTLPRNAVWFTIGTLLICGAPPSPLFATELLLVSRLSPGVAITVLLLLGAIFAAMTDIVLHMVMGKPAETPPERVAKFAAAERFALLPQAALIVALLAGAVFLGGLCIYRS